MEADLTGDGLSDSVGGGALVDSGVLALHLVDGQQVAGLNLDAVR